MDYLVPQTRPLVGAAERDAVAAVIDDAWLSEGPRAAEFLDGLLELTGAPHGVLAPNGTLALALGLLGLGIGPGDEVLVPDLTFIGSATAVSLVGARPVFVDVERGTLQLDLADCERALTAATAAVMPVHLFGGSADMTRIAEWAAARGLRVIEDAAQAIGVTHRGQHAGTFGDVGCFSFFSDKTISTGEGGLVVCRSEEVHERLLLLRNQGRLSRGAFLHPAIGFNFRMTDLQCAVGVQQLDRLPAIIDRKHEILGRYEAALAELPLTFYRPPEHSSLVPFRAVVFVDDAGPLAEHLEAAGVQTRRMFYPLHLQPAYAELVAERPRVFTGSTEAYRSGLLLPVFPAMTDEQVDVVIGAVRSFFSTAASAAPMRAGAPVA